MLLRQDKPIIQHRTDTDFYKFSTGRFIYELFPDVNVTFGFKNRREGTGLAKIIDEGELREQLTAFQNLAFTASELHYLGGTYEYDTERMFPNSYIDFLKTSRLPEFHLERVGDEYRLEFGGPWQLSTFWETPALSIIAELYFKAQLKDKTRLEKDRILAEGLVRFAEKLEIIKGYSDITYSDFCTRRRASFDNQDYIVGISVEEMSQPKQFLGTSNVWLANKYSTMPMGTSPHEPQMVMAALANTDEEIRSSQFKFTSLWWQMYGKGLSIFLPDTYGTPWVLKNAPSELAINWRGSRQDSMDPYQYGERKIQFYEKHGVNPMEKIIVCSDGLDVFTMVKISEYFRNRIPVTYGWGTNEGNDFPGCPALPMVIKPISVNGRGIVKLSDNIAKATGIPEDIEKYKKIFQYDDMYYKECRY